MGAEELEAALNKASGVAGAGAERMPFTSRAKHAVFFDSSDEARAAGHDYVGGEHILLALLGEQQGLAARVLDSRGITLAQARKHVGRRGGAGDETTGRLDHNSEANRAVEQAQAEAHAEAKALDHKRVGTAHVLLALLAQSDGAALRVMRDLGEEPQRLRERLLAEIEAGHGDYEDFSPAARDVVALAEDEARGLDDEHVGSEHLLLALLREQRSVAFRALKSLGVTPGAARAAVIATTAGGSESPAGPIALADDAKRALGLATAEARSSGSYVNPEHVLLGLACEANGAGARIVIELAGGSDQIRGAILRELSELTGHEGPGFFERFSARAGQVVVLAQEEARGLEHAKISSEHILLGLVREQQSAEAGLGELDIDVERVREQVTRCTDPNANPSAALLPFAASATKVFDLGSRDAVWLEHDCIAPEHLALGLARETEGVGARVLQELNVEGEQLRSQALRALGASWASELSPAEEELSRREQHLRATQRRYREASTDEERREQATWVEIAESIVDDARGKVLPENCREALKVLVGFATEEWLKGQPPTEDPDHRRWYREHCSTNIESQLVRVLFHPSLGPEANPITGHPGGPDAPDPRQGGTSFTLKG